MEKKKNKRQNPSEGIIKYFREVIAESKKVVWPTREKTIRLTIIVLAVSTVTAIFMTALDYLFNFVTLGF